MTERRTWLPVLGVLGLAGVVSLLVVLGQPSIDVERLRVEVPGVEVAEAGGSVSLDAALYLPEGASADAPVRRCCSPTGSSVTGPRPTRKPVSSLPTGSWFSADVALGRILVIVAYIAWSSAWVAAVAFAWSTLTDVPVGAVAGTIVLVIVVQILDAITALGAIRTFLPVHELNAWLGLLATPPQWSELSRGILLQVPFVADGLGFAFWWFARKDVLSSDGPGPEEPTRPDRSARHHAVTRRTAVPLGR